MSFGGGSNPPWQRPLGASAGQQNAIANLQSQMINTNLVGFQSFGQNLAIAQQAQQSNLTLIPPLGANLNALNNTFNTIQYPNPNARNALNTAFNQVQGTQQIIQQQQQQLHHHQAQQHQQTHPPQTSHNNQNNAASAQMCSKIGIVTKYQNSYGFVDDEIIFHKNICKGGNIPKIGDRVLVEATFCNNSQFKWNATSVQVTASSINQNLNTRQNGNPSHQAQQQPGPMQNEQPSRGYAPFNANLTSSSSFVANFDRSNNNQLRSTNHTASRQTPPPRRASPERNSRRDEADDLRRRREKERERERER